MEKILVREIDSWAYMPREVYHGCYDLFLHNLTQLSEGWNMIPMGFFLEIPEGMGMLVQCSEENMMSGYFDEDGIEREIDIVPSFISSDDHREVCVSLYSHRECIMSAGTLIASMRVVSVPDVELVEGEDASGRID